MKSFPWWRLVSFLRAIFFSVCFLFVSRILRFCAVQARRVLRPGGAAAWGTLVTGSRGSALVPAASHSYRSPVGEHPPPCRHPSTLGTSGNQDIAMLGHFGHLASCLVT